MSKNEPIALAQEGTDRANDDGKVHLNGNVDAVLSPDAVHLWVEVGNIAVYIWQGDEGVSVDLYPNHQEYLEPLASAWASYSEAEEAGEIAWT